MKRKFPNSKRKISEDHSTREQEALAFLHQGKLQEAEAIYRSLIDQGSNNHLSYGNLAAICGMTGRLEELMVLLKTALDLEPNYPEAHINMGNTLKQQGKLDPAIASYHKALEIDPNLPDAHNNLGIVLKGQGKLDAAIASYHKALELKPNYPEAHYNLGIALKQQGKLAAAIVSYHKALELKPNYPDAHVNLGVALQDQGKLEAAIACFQKALELKPNFPAGHINLGVALREQGNLDAAIASYHKALELKANYPEAHFNLGNALQEQGKLAAAIASIHKAVELRPNYPDAQINLAFALLLVGDYKLGWEKYDWRSKRGKEPAMPLALPKSQKWAGETLSPNQKLLLVSEQGLGDTLQFMRYALHLKSQGIDVSFCAQPELHSLIQASGIDPKPLTPEQANTVTEGYWSPLLSVPRHLEISPEKPIITEPYIATTAELINKWGDILASEKRPIIGINWQGNPKAEKSSSRGRSLPLETFSPITSRHNGSLLALQKGFGSEQLGTCSFRDRFVTCQEQVNATWDFLETAAIITHCDLVITSDTAVAHLAGGLGKATWLLLHTASEWRWGMEGDTTFWYPSMRLFRQKERGNWAEVMERVAAELQKVF